MRREVSNAACAMPPTMGSPSAMVGATSRRRFFLSDFLLVFLLEINACGCCGASSFVALSSCDCICATISAHGCNASSLPTSTLPMGIEHAASAYMKEVEIVFHHSCTSVVLPKPASPVMNKTLPLPSSIC